MASKKTKDEGELVALPANTPKGAELMAEATVLCESLCVTTIDSPIIYELAATELQELQAKYKALEDKRFAITRPMDAAKKLILELFKPALDVLDVKIKALKGAMLAYDAEEKRKAAIRQAALDKIAADQKAQLAAEAARQAEEARVQSERAAKLMEQGDSAGFNEAMNAAEAAQEMASALGQTSEVVSAATALKAVPTVAGITTADVWKARVTDVAALLRFIADHPEHHDWIEFKMTGLHELAKAQRTELRIPGVEAFEESRIAAARKVA